MLNICIVITNYCTWTDTIECVESILFTHQDYKYLALVDNASENDSFKNLQTYLCTRHRVYDFDHTVIDNAGSIQKRTFQDCISAQKPRIFLIRSERNNGYAGGNNIGIALSRKLNVDAIWFLNNDTVVAPGAARAMHERLFACNRPGLVGSLVLYYFNPNYIQCRAGGFTNTWTFLSRMNGHVLPLDKADNASVDEIEKKINFIYGASVMASKQFVDATGPMDERLFLYCEEQDWAWSAKGKFDLAYAKKALVFHKEGMSTGMTKHARPLRRLLLLSRNKILVGLKHNRYAVPVICVCILYAAARMILRGLFGGKLPATR